MAEPGTIRPPLRGTPPGRPSRPGRSGCRSVGDLLDLDPAGVLHRLAGAAAGGEVAQAGLQLVGGQVGQDRLAALGRAQDQPAALGLAGAEVVRGVVWLPSPPVTRRSGLKGPLTERTWTANGPLTSRVGMASSAVPPLAIGSPNSPGAGRWPWRWSPARPPGAGSGWGW